MQKAHSASNNNHWKDYPNTSSPIIADQLNRIETNLDVVDDRVVAFDTSKADQTDLLTCLSDVTFNDTTGVFTFTFKNGNTYSADLNIEKIPVSFSMDAYGVITMTTADGTQYTADVSSIIKTYSFDDSSQIDFTVTTDASGNKTVTASIVTGSITETMLQPNFLADCQAEVTAATGQAETAEAWAKGTKGGIPVTSGDSQYNNNAKYFSDTSKENSEDSEAWAKGTRNGSAVAPTDPAYHNNAKYYAELINPTQLSALTDTNISAPSNGQALVYNSVSQKWENANASGGSSSLNDLTDVTITSASNGQILKYNSSTQKWENVSVPSETWSSAVSCAVGATSCTITNAAILTTSIIEDYSENTSGTKVNVPQITVTTGQAVLSFNALTEATSFKIKIIN